MRDRLSEHISLMILGLPEMLAWLEQRLQDDESVPATGTRTVTSIALSPRTFPGFLRMLTAAAKTATGRAG